MQLEEDHLSHLTERGMILNFFLPWWLVPHCTTYQPRSPSFLFLFSLSCVSQCEGVCGCGGLVSIWWSPVGVFMVYFWPQQQKACWCSKSVAPIVSITLLLNRLAPLSLAHWQTLPNSAHAAILTMMLQWVHTLTACQENEQRSVSLSNIGPTQLSCAPASCLLPVSLPFSSSKASKKLHPTLLLIKHEWDYANICKIVSLNLHAGICFVLFHCRLPFSP